MSVNRRINELQPINVFLNIFNGTTLQDSVAHTGVHCFLLCVGPVNGVLDRVPHTCMSYMLTCTCADILSIGTFSLQPLAYCYNVSQRFYFFIHGGFSAIRCFQTRCQKNLLESGLPLSSRLHKQVNKTCLAMSISLLCIYIHIFDFNKEGHIHIGDFNNTSVTT